MEKYADNFTPCAYFPKIIIETEENTMKSTQKKKKKPPLC